MLDAGFETLNVTKPSGNILKKKAKTTRFMWSKNPHLEILLLQIVKNQFCAKVNSSSVPSAVWDSVETALKKEMTADVLAREAITASSIKSYCRNMKKQYVDYINSELNSRPRHLELLQDIFGQYVQPCSASCQDQKEPIKDRQARPMELPTAAPAESAQDCAGQQSSCEENDVVVVNALAEKSTPRLTPSTKSLPDRVIATSTNLSLFFATEQRTPEIRTDALDSRSRLTEQSSSCIVCGVTLCGLSQHLRTQHFDVCLNELYNRPFLSAPSPGITKVLELLSACPFCKVSWAKAGISIPKLKLGHLKTCCKLHHDGHLDHLMLELSARADGVFPVAPGPAAADAASKTSRLPPALQFLKPPPKVVKPARKGVQKTIDVLLKKQEPGLFVERTSAVLYPTTNRINASETEQSIFKKTIRNFGSPSASSSHNSMWEYGHGVLTIPNEIEAITELYQGSVQTSESSLPPDTASISAPPAQPVLIGEAHTTTVSQPANNLFNAHPPSPDAVPPDANSDCFESAGQPQSASIPARPGSKNQSLQDCFSESNGLNTGSPAHSSPWSSPKGQINDRVSLSDFSAASLFQTSLKASNPFPVRKKQAPLDPPHIPRLQFRPTETLDIAPSRAELLFSGLVTASYTPASNLSFSAVELHSYIPTVSETLDFGGQTGVAMLEQSTQTDHLEHAAVIPEIYTSQASSAPVNIPQSSQQLDSLCTKPKVSVSLSEQDLFSHSERDLFASGPDLAYLSQESQDLLVLQRDVFRESSPIDVIAHATSLLQTNGGSQGSALERDFGSQNNPAGPVDPRDSYSDTDSEMLQEEEAASCSDIDSEVSLTSTIMEPTQPGQENEPAGVFAKIGKRRTSRRPSGAPAKPLYEQMELPELKAIASQYGLKTTASRGFLVSKLDEIWRALHGTRPTSPSKPKVSEDDQNQRIFKAIQADHFLYSKMLCFEPLPFDAVFATLSGSPSLEFLTRKKLKSFLDQQGINVQTEGRREGRSRGRSHR
ncbi:hypothetical protein HDV03_001997 [Kappamyces sp. JEL0829]|nr:hypothetical protein HDV03_001997 [Kappamyces sp. JEL0829]